MRASPHLLFTLLALLAVGGLFSLAWIRQPRDQARVVDSGAWLLWGLTVLALLIVCGTLFLLFAGFKPDLF